MLTHTGRRTGLTRNAVIEVVACDKMAGTYIIASGWGEKSDWFRNIQKNPKVGVAVAGRRFDALTRRLPVQEAQQALWDYARKSPMAFRELAGLMLGERLAPTEEACHRLAASIPLVLIQPVE